MNQEMSFGSIVKEHRRLLDLTQAELARRVGCATITIRKIEADALRPSVQIAERLAMALAIPLEERAAFVRLGRMASLADQSPPPIPTPPVAPEEIGQKDLSGRAIRGYQLGQRIGSGGFGAVYRAVQPLVEREVAIKIILPQYANHPDFIRRFEAEAQLVARLEHPHIVPLYDYWREPGVAYLVMRLLRAGNLENVLKEGPLPLEAIARVFEQIGAALHAAHRTGVVHRDIKPANILLDEDGNGYLADFGIAKNLGNPNWEDQTQLGAIVGSPHYLSPEQIRSEAVRPQTDIYALGVMLYELLTGQKPFRGKTPIALIQQHLETPVPSLVAPQPDPSADLAQPNLEQTIKPLSPALDAILQRATAKNMEERYSDMVAMLTDLRRVLAPDGAPTLLSQSPTGAPLETELTLLTLQDLENPYKGLRAFSEVDADDFFGRDTLVQQLLGRMGEVGDPAAGSRQDLARFLAVVGPSGSGKSSVVRAGLIPALRRGGLPGSEAWFVVEMIPGSHPLEELEAALLRVAVNPPQSLLAQLQEDQRGLLRAVRRVLPADDDIELVLVIDQFEEIFTLVNDEIARAHFLDSLVTAVLDPRSRIRVIITLRADFTDRPLQYVDFGELVRQRTEFVLPLTPDELEQAVAGPARRVGMTLELGLVATIIQEIGDQPGTLPLLQYALTELFERREGRKLIRTAYQDSGGVLGALARRAEELYQGLNETEQELTRQLFLRLVTLGEGTEDTRRRVLRSELTAMQPSPNPSQPVLSEVEGREGNSASPPLGGIEGGLNAVIDQFGRYRLLTFDHDPVTRGPTVEVAHEALLREWTRLRGWLDESRADIRLQRLLASAANEWLQADRDPGFLLRGSRLDQFEGWAASTDVASTENERAYLGASLTARQEREAEEESRRQRELETAQKLAETEKQRAEEQTQAAGRLRRRAIFLTGALVIAGILAVVAVIFGQQASQNEQQALEQQAIAVVEAEQRATAQAQAEAERAEAEHQAQIATSRELAAAALNNLNTDPERSILLALHGLSTAHTLEAESALHQSILTSRVRHVLTNTGVLVDTSREGRQQFGVTISYAVEDAVYSPDGTRLATAGVQGATVWDTASYQALVTLTGHKDTLKKVLFTSDGSLIITASEDRTAKVWEAASGRELFTLVGHTGPLVYAALSPDDKYLVTASGARGADSEDRTAIVWDFAASVAESEGRELFTLSGHEADLRAVEISPDGTRIATAGEDNTVRLWDVATGQELSILDSEASGLSGWVQALTFSPDGRHLAGGIADGGVVVWNASTGQRLIRLYMGTGESVQEVAFSPDGSYLAAASQAGFAKVWAITPEGWRETFNLVGHTVLMSGITFSPDGKNLVTTSIDGTARVWDISPSGNEELHTLAGHTNALAGLAFSPDGTRLASASWDKMAKIWDAVSGQELLTLSGHTNRVQDIAYSSDGKYLATASEDATAKIWDATTGEPLLTLTGHKQGNTFNFFEGVLNVDFSPDGTRLATAGADNTAKIWDIAPALETGATSLEPTLTLTGHEHGLSSVAFSPDGTRLVTGSSDDTMRVWDAVTGEELHRLSGNFSWVFNINFSPDGTRLVTAHANAEAILWQFPQGSDPPRQLIPLESITGFVGNATLSPDGTRVATAGAAVKVFDATSGEPLLILDQAAKPAAAVFSPDGKRLAVGGFDNLIHIYTLDIDELKELAQSRVTRSLTTEECKQYLHVEECPAGF